MKNNTFTAYEVLRIIKSKPLFAYDHYLRLYNSVSFYKPDIQYSYNSFINLCKTCIAKNQIDFGNIKIELIASEQDNEFKTIIKQIPHKYPSSEQYNLGVKTMTYKHVRTNPNNKIWNEQLRIKIDNFIADNNIYEALYINETNILSEGSRSNLFFLNDAKLFSAPSAEILPGITRKYIIDVAKSLGIELIEKEISLDEISKYDSAFISGTSPKILPICLINNVKFNVSNNNLQKLMFEFNQVIDEHIENLEF